MKPDFTRQFERRVLLHAKDQTTVVIMSEITHIECDGYMCFLYFTKGSFHRCTKMLKYFEKEFNGYGFLRANRSTLVNSRYIRYIDKFNGTWFVHLMDMKVRVSRRRIHDLKYFITSVS